MDQHDATGTRLAFSVSEAAEMVNLGKTKFRELVRTGAIESVRAGRRILIPARALEKWLKTQAEASKST